MGWNVRVWHLSSRRTPRQVGNVLYAYLLSEEQVQIWQGAENEGNMGDLPRQVHDLFDGDVGGGPPPGPGRVSDAHAENVPNSSVPLPSAQQADMPESDPDDSDVELVFEEPDAVAEVLEQIRGGLAASPSRSSSTTSTSSDSESTSSSSSESGSGPAGAEPADENPTHARGSQAASQPVDIVREGPLTKYTPSEEAFSGFLRFNNKEQSLCAHCTWHGAQKCRRTRTVLPGKKKGQGRPLGHLGAWLLAGPEMSAEQHAKHRPDHETRVAARARLHGDENMKPVFALERPAEGEEESEPDVFG